jgi:predicted transcriptional regulator
MLKLPTAENTLTDANSALTLTSRIVRAFGARNPLPSGELTAVLGSVHQTLSRLAEGEPERRPAVEIRASVTPDNIVCLEDGKRLKMLKRYLRSRFGLTPEAYRAKWNLSADYPMTAPNYAARRSALAKEIGLGKAGKKIGARKKKRAR